MVRSSSTISIRMSKDAKGFLMQLAKRDHVSINSKAVQLLKTAIELEQGSKTK